MIHIEYLICIHSTPSGRLNPPISSDPSWKISRFLATSGYWHPFTWCISQIPHWWNFNSAKNPNFHVKTSCAFSETAAFDAKIVTFKYLLTFAKIVIAFPLRKRMFGFAFSSISAAKEHQKGCVSTQGTTILYQIPQHGWSLTLLMTILGLIPRVIVDEISSLDPHRPSQIHAFPI